MTVYLSNFWSWWTELVRAGFASRGYYERMSGDMEIYAALALVLLVLVVPMLSAYVAIWMKTCIRKIQHRRERREAEATRRAERMESRIQAAMLYELAMVFSDNSSVVEPSSEPEELTEAYNRLMKVAGLQA